MTELLKKIDNDIYTYQLGNRIIIWNAVTLDVGYMLDRSFHDEDIKKYLRIVKLIVILKFARKMTIF